MQAHALAYDIALSITSKKVLSYRHKEINTLSYNTSILISSEKSFIVQAHGDNHTCLQYLSII